MPYPNPADLDAIRKDPNVTGARAAGPQHRLPRLQHHRRSPSTTCACARPSTWRSTRRRSSTPSTRAPASRRRTRSRRRCGPTTTRQGRPVRSGRRQEAARRGRRPERLRDRPLGDAGAAALQPERQAHRRADAGRPRQGRRQGRAHDLRVGRVPQAHAGGRAPDAACSAGPATTATRTTSCTRCSAATPRSPAAATSRSGATRRSRTWSQKAKVTSDQSERTELYEKAQVDLQGAGAVVHDRALGAAEAGAQGSRRLQALALRPPHVLRRRHQAVAPGCGNVREGPGRAPSFSPPKHELPCVRWTTLQAASRAVTP